MKYHVTHIIVHKRLCQFMLNTKAGELKDLWNTRLREGITAKWK